MAYGIAILIGAGVGGATGAGWWKLFEVHRRQITKLKEKPPSGARGPGEEKQTQPPPSQRQNNVVQQKTSGPGSPTIQGVQGDVNVTVDQSSGKTKPEKPQPKKPAQK